MKYDDMRLACIRGYEWPAELISLTEVLDTLAGVLDINTLRKLIDTYSKSEDIVVTLVTKEYLGVAKLWLSMLSLVEVKQYIVIAGDVETGLFLDSMNVPNCKVILKNHDDKKNKFTSPTGFTEKGLAISVLKFPFVKLLVELGYNVLLIDIDALLLMKPSAEYFENADVAFQRIVYFPPQIAEIWGFAACGGCFWFRANKKAIGFINKVIDIQRITYDDQIALNVALWESNIQWDISGGNEQYISFNNEIEDTKSYFKDQSAKTFDGIIEAQGMNIRALSPALFWRNDIVPLDLSKVVIFHPNSPKTEAGKLEVFKKYGFS